MFKIIHGIDDVRLAVKEKKEIKFVKQPNGTTIGCYTMWDSTTFDSPESLECRGITFNDQGAIISRPLHMFFNVGDNKAVTIESICTRTDIVAIYNKLDGSMVSTALVNGKVEWHTKSTFETEIIDMLN